MSAIVKTVADPKLAQMLEYANTLIRSSPDGVIAIDIKLRITEWNLLMEQMCGKRREQVIGLDLADIPFMKETGEVDRITAGLDGKEICNREVVYRIPGTNRDGIFESVVALLRGPTGENIGAVLRIRDITERKRMADVATESENRLRTVLDSKQAGIIIIDPDTHKIVDVNPFAASMVGAARETIVGAECHKFICPAERGHCPITDLHQTIDNRECVLLTASGEGRDIIKTVSMVQLDNKPHLLESFIDITARKRTEQALSDSEARLSSIFDPVQDGILVADAHTRRFRMANVAICNMLGYTLDELLNLGVEDIHPGEQLANVNLQFERQLKGDITLVTLPVKRKDGSVFHADINTASATIGGQRYITGVFRDISVRLQADLALRKSEKFLDTLLNAIPVPVFYKDRDGRYLGFNNAYETFIGATRDQLIGKSVFDISPPELAKIYHAKDLELYESGEKQRYESRVKDALGSIHDVIFSKAVFRDSQGVVSGLIGAVLDITDRKRAEQAEERASRDGLTGLYNHRTFYALLKDEISRSERTDQPLSLLMLDIDFFKRVNDTHGHQAGDAILIGISDLLQTEARAIDLVCRYGGEEITIILPGTNELGAMKIAERIRAAVAGRLFDITEGKAININVSIGVATYPQHVHTLEDFVKAADVALYSAKQGGRNRVCRYGI